MVSFRHENDTRGWRASDLILNFSRIGFEHYASGIGGFDNFHLGDAATLEIHGTTTVRKPRVVGHEIMDTFAAGHRGCFGVQR